MAVERRAFKDGVRRFSIERDSIASLLSLKTVRDDAASPRCVASVEPVPINQFEYVFVQLSRTG